jgi:hypothetical protein
MMWRYVEAARLMVELVNADSAHTYVLPATHHTEQVDAFGSAL